MTMSDSHNRSLVGWLSLAQLIAWGSVFYLFALIMEPVERELGLSRAQSSLAFSLALLAEGVLAFPVGRWIDQGHERLVMTAGSVWLGICLVLQSTVSSMAGFYAVWIGLGAGMAATLYTPVFAVVTRRFPGDFRRAIITMTFLGGLASTVFVPLIYWLIAQFGWRHALWFLAAFQFAVCAPLHFLCLKNAPKPLPGAAQHLSTGHKRSVSLAHHLTSTPYLLIGIFTVLTMAITVALPAHIINLLREQGLGDAWAIAVPASIGVCQVVGRLLLYFFEHHFDVHTANRVIPCLIPIALVALLATALAPHAIAGGTGLSRAHWLVLAFVLLWGMGNGMLTIVKGTAIAEYVSRDNVAALNGALGIPMALARAAAPIGMGLLWSEQAGYTIGLWVLLALSVMSIAALAMAQRLSLRRSGA
jgi:MFS family permease